jgi:membrane protein DedA with SNARE-associated domain
MDLHIHWIKAYGYPGLFAALMLGMFGLPVPDETILTFAGYQIFQQRLDLAPALLAA